MTLPIIDREAVARLVDRTAWENHDRLTAPPQDYEATRDIDYQACRARAERAVAQSLAIADQILALSPSVPEEVLQEPKYRFERGHAVNRASGETIPHDEPVMLFRARDKRALAMIEYYAALVGSGDPEHVEAVHRRHEDFAAFARNHPERMKEPDTDLRSLAPSPGRD